MDRDGEKSRIEKNFKAVRTPSRSPAVKESTVLLTALPDVSWRVFDILQFAKRREKGAGASQINSLMQVYLLF